ncbi:MAG: Ig-like domain repeat protein [Silvibacterium sp.]
MRIAFVVMPNFRKPGASRDTSCSLRDALAAAQEAGAVNFGTANVCPSGQTTPPCSQTLTLKYTFSTTETLGAPRALTQGASNLDFRVINGGTCLSNSSFTSGTSCTVNVAFAPIAPGTRYGAVQLVDGSGSVLATTYIYGTGQGPEVAFNPGTASVLNTGSYSLNGAVGVAVDGAGNVYLSEYNPNAAGRIVVVNATGVASVLNTGSYSLNPFGGLTVDGAGTLYISDTFNKRIVEVTADGIASVLDVGSPGGEVLSGPTGVAVDRAGTVYIADQLSNRIIEVTASGVASVLNVGSPGGVNLNAPFGVAVDGAGNVYIADTFNSRIVEVTVAGKTVVLNTGSPDGTSLSYPYGLAVDGSGNLYIADEQNSRTVEVLSSGTVSVLNSSLPYPFDVAVDRSENLFIVGDGIVKLDQADASPLSFTTTNVGQVSSDSPRTVTVENLGNGDLVFGTPSTGTNPSYPTNFPENPDGEDLCAADTPLAAAATCNLSVDFKPTVAGNNIGVVVLTDNNLNSSQVTQQIQLSGIGQSSSPTTTTLTASPMGAAGYGEQVTLKATVTASGGTPIGAVSFYDGVTLLGTVTAVGGDAAYATDTLRVGMHTLTAQFSSVSSCCNSTSNSISYTVNPDQPAAIAATAGSPQSAYVNEAFATALTVTATDAHGNPLGLQTVSFSAPASGATATLSSSTAVTAADGQAGVTATANGTVGNYTVTAAIGSLKGSFSLSNQPPPRYVVTVNTDTTSGVASNCPIGGPSNNNGANCSLRDALAAASATNSGNITFSSSAFATPQTITLSNGGLNLPSNTTIAGPATGSPASTNLVTVSGNQYTVFYVNNGVTNAVISWLNITGAYNIGEYTDQGIGDPYGGIYSDGVLTVTNSVISGNTLYELPGGAGIFNDYDGTLTLTNSTVAGNTANYTYFPIQDNICEGGGGILNNGTLTVVNSAIVGNSISDCANGGGGILNQGALTLTDSTVSGNSGSNAPDTGVGDGPVNSSGGGIFSVGTMTTTNSIVADNTFNYSNSLTGPTQEDDCDGSGCPTNGTNGNVVGMGLSSTLPGSHAICAGLLWDIPPGLTMDQRGVPRTTTYSTSSGNVTCIDSGAIQTHYSLSFGQEPLATVAVNESFTAAVQLNESGSPFQVSGVTIPLALGKGDSGTLSGGTAETNATGVATYSNLSVSAPGMDTLVGAIPVTATPPPAPLTSPLRISATSTQFDVTSSTQIHVTIGTSPAGLAFSVDGTTYTRSATLAWTSGSQHTIATTSPQLAPGTQYTFASWNDGGAISHTVTASASVTSYTATFATSYQLTTLVKSSSEGTVSPTSGGYYAAGTTVNLGAQPNSGYVFTAWTTTTNATIGNAQTPNTYVTMSAPENVTANFEGVPSYMVTVTTDDAGNGANCTDQNLPGAKPDAGCSLRDALAAAAGIYYPCVLNCAPINITFDPTVFSTSQTITISLPLNILSNTTIVGPTTGSAATRTTLVRVNGNGGVPQVFDIPYQSQVLNAVISGLTITGGIGDMGAGIYNGGMLTLIDCTITGNNGNVGQINNGGGIYNDVPGVLTVIDSTISGNSVQNGIGGGIYNAPGDPVLSPGGGTLTIINSTISNNSGGNLYNGGTLAVSNSIVDDCSTTGVTACPTTSTNGNVVTANSMLAPLGNYGGPTPTMPPLPGSPAICAAGGASVQTDQRGFPRPANYNGTVCYDSGAVQTNYSLSFSAEPPASVGIGASFASAVQLSESHSPFPVSGVSIPLALGKGDNGTLSGGNTSTNGNGIAVFSNLSVSTAGTDDTLVAVLPVTSAPPPALAAPVSISATSSFFDVGKTAQTITFPTLVSPVTYGVAPILLNATASSGLAVSYSVTGPATVNGSTLTVTGVGTVTVTVSQPGNAGTASATPVTHSFLVTPATLTVRANSVSRPYNTANPAFSYAITGLVNADNSSVVSGTATLTTTATTTSPAAQYPITFLTENLVAVNYTFTYVNATLTVTGGVAQAISFTAPANVTYGVPPIKLTATASSGLAVSFTVTGPAAVSGNTLMITGAGTVVVTASQAGNSDYAAATPVWQTIIVNQAASTITLNSSATSATLGAPVTFTAAVASSPGTPTGRVEFANGTTVFGTTALNAQGIAAYTTSTLTAGSHSITAAYSGDQNFAGSQAMLTQTVTAPAFSLSADPTSLTLKRGESGQIKITLTPIGGYNGLLTLACAGLPELASCSFNPTTLTANGSNSKLSTVMTITTTGPNSGMVGLFKPNGPPLSGTTPTLLCWLPGGLLGFVLVWQNRRRSPSTRRVMWLVTLFAATSGFIACGAPPSTPVGSSTITVTASGSGNSTQSIALTITVTK